MRTDLQGVTPELADVISTLIDSVMVNVNICLPAKVVKYDKKTQYADVQIQLLTKYEDGSLVKKPVIPNVPVKHPRASGGKAFIHMPIKVGDDVTLIFSQRSLDNWKTQGGMQDPNDRRKFHMTDAYALIGGSSIPDAFSPKTDDAIEITNGDGSIQIFPSGKFNISNGTDNLFDLVSQMADQSSQISNAGGPTFNAAQFVALKLKIDAMKGP